MICSALGILWERLNAAPYRAHRRTTLLLVLLTWLLVLLALLIRSLALIGGGMHAGASAIRLGAGPVAIAAHGGAGLVISQPAGAFIVNGLVLDSSVAADQAMIAVAATVWHIRPVAVVPVVGLIAGVVTVVLLFLFPLLLLLLLFLLMLFLVM